MRYLFTVTVIVLDPCQYCWMLQRRTHNLMFTTPLNSSWSHYLNGTCANICHFLETDYTKNNNPSEIISLYSMHWVSSDVLYTDVSLQITHGKTTKWPWELIGIKSLMYIFRLKQYVSPYSLMLRITTCKKY